MDGEEEHSLEVPAAANPLEDSSDRMNRLIVMQKKVIGSAEAKEINFIGSHIKFCTCKLFYTNLNLE